MFASWGAGSTAMFHQDQVLGGVPPNSNFPETPITRRQYSPLNVCFPSEQRESVDKHRSRDISAMSATNRKHIIIVSQYRALILVTNRSNPQRLHGNAFGPKCH
jgi:hypothetical protein